MIGYVVRRIMLGAFTAWLVTVLSFVIIQLPEGDAVDRHLDVLMAGGDQTAAGEYEQLRDYLGLDDPMHIRYGKWVWNMLQGDLGFSMFAPTFEHSPSPHTVKEVVGDRIWLTIALTSFTMAVTWIFAIPIGIYSAVGLAPSHIAALFLAEAAVFATLGAVFGYMIGQTLVLVLYEQGWLGGLSLNYSSLSAVSSTLMVMLTVFLSALYPAKKAEEMSVPDVTRRWQFPEPDGDNWAFDFPFTMGGTEALGMYTYLKRSFESYGEGSIGRFASESVRFTSEDRPTGHEYEIALRAWLAPYDMGISQDVRMHAVPTGEHDIYRIEVQIHRLSGDVNSWQRVNRGFLNDIRKLFLVWKTMPPQTKVEYTDEGSALLGASEEPVNA